jgi:hypothetical protein
MRADGSGTVICDGETDGCPNAGQGWAGNILQHNCPPEPANDARYDREAKPRALLCRLAAAEERLEYPIEVA